MSKVAFTRLQLDKEIADQITRAGLLPNPMHQVLTYVVDRNYPGPVRITVTFIADEKFSILTDGPVAYWPDDNG